MRTKIIFFSIFFSFIPLLAWGQKQKPLAYETVHILRGHTDKVYNLRFSPDGKTLATCGIDGKIFLWDVASGQQMAMLSGHIKEVIEVTFSHDGSILASAGSDGTARVWDLTTMRETHQFTTQLHPVEGIKRNGVSFVCFSQNDKTLYYGGESGYVMVVGLAKDAAEPRCLFSTNDLKTGNWYSHITGGSLSRSGALLYISIENNLIEINATNGAYQTGLLSLSSAYNDVFCEPYPNYITAWMWSGHVQVYNMVTKRLIKQLKVSPNLTYSFASFNKEKRLLATGGDASLAKLWDWKKGKVVSTLSGHSNMVRAVRFSPTEDLIATASYDSTTRIWRQSKDIVPQLIHPDGDSVLAKSIEPTLVEQDTLSEEMMTRNEMTLRDTLPKRIKRSDNLGSKTKKTNRKEIVEFAINEDDLVVGKTIKLENLQFKQGTAELLPIGKPELEKLRYLMLKYPSLVIELAGHTDNIGLPHLNLKLSSDRVRVIQNYLTGEGIAEKRIITSAYGDTKPIASNETEETRRLNRRVEVTIIAL